MRFLVCATKRAGVPALHKLSSKMGWAFVIFCSYLMRLTLKQIIPSEKSSDDLGTLSRTLKGPT